MRQAKLMCLGLLAIAVSLILLPGITLADDYSCCGPGMTPNTFPLDRDGDELGHCVCENPDSDSEVDEIDVGTTVESACVLNGDPSIECDWTPLRKLPDSGCDAVTSLLGDFPENMQAYLCRNQNTICPCAACPIAIYGTLGQCSLNPDGASLNIPITYHCSPEGTEYECHSAPQQKESPSTSSKNGVTLQ